MMRVGIGRESVWSATAPMQLFGTPYLAPVGNPGRTYDLSANGERFLMIKSASADPTSQLPSFIVVQNWHEELKQRVPVR
jgi:hypothetical protein